MLIFKHSKFQKLLIIVAQSRVKERIYQEVIKMTLLLAVENAHDAAQFF